MTNAFRLNQVRTTGPASTAETQYKLNDVREHQIHKKEENRSNCRHHKDSDGGGPGFATCSPGNAVDFLADLPDELCWRCLCHGGSMPIQVSKIASDAKARRKIGHVARFVPHDVPVQVVK